MFIPRTSYIVYIVFNIVHSAILTLGMPPGVGVLTCRHQIPCASPLNLAWGSENVVDRCFTHNFMYHCHIYKKVGMLLHTKLNNSQMYFRDIPIDYHDL